VSPETHLLASWIIAAKTTDNPRDCRLVTLAGLAPDLDGLGLLVDWGREALGMKPLDLYPTYHHILLHGIFGAVLVSVILAGFARQRLRVAVLAFLVFHLHLFCDFIGSRGPLPTDLWPIYYFGPFRLRPMWEWSGQMRLDGWFNRYLTVALFLWALWLPIKLGHSVVGVFNRRADEVVVGVLRKWHAALFSRKRKNF